MAQFLREDLTPLIRIIAVALQLVDGFLDGPGNDDRVQDVLLKGRQDRAVDGLNGQAQAFAADRVASEVEARTAVKTLPRLLAVGVAPHANRGAAMGAGREATQ